MIVLVLPILILLILLLVVVLFPTEKESTQKDNKIPPKLQNPKSFLGQSHFKLGHKETIDDTNQKADCQDEKDNKFVSSEEFPEDNPPLDIDYSLEPESELSDEELDEESEELESLMGKDAELATGVAFEDLFKTKEVIENTQASPQEEQEAGKILYENQHTVLFEELVSTQKSTGVRIASLVEIHLARLNEKLTELEENSSSNAEDYKNFNIEDYTNN